jgi:hypothetical protein
MSNNSINTPTDHNKVLGIIHVAYGIGNLALVVLIAVIVFGVLGIAALGSRGGGGEALGIGIIGFIMLIVLIVNAVLTLPEFIAGYALLKRKRWARTASLISAILEALNFPFGTARCVYTLWFMFSDQGRRLYDKSHHALPPTPPQWVSVSMGNQQPVYVPPASPPDWR